MTQEEIFEGNKIIAEFMGGNINNIDFYRDFSGCEYYSSWNWLMPVIGKISNQCEEPDELDWVRNALLCNDINTAYEFVVDYIKYK